MQQHIMTDGNHGLGDDVQIMPMPTYPLDVDAAVVVSPALSPSDKATLVESLKNFIRVALRTLPPTDYNPTRVEPYRRFAWSRLIRELHNQFADLESVDFAVDTDLQPALALPSLRNLNLAVTV